MDEKLFRSVADQCLELGVRRYTLYLMNEPLLDRHLPERVAYISARIKKPQYTKITTHGGLLTEDMARRLLDAGRGLGQRDRHGEGLDEESCGE